MPAFHHRPHFASADSSTPSVLAAGSTLRRGLLFVAVATVATAATAGPAFAADVQPPSAPGPLVQTPLDFGKTQLSWGASTDDTGVTSYEIDAPANGLNAAVHLVVDGSTTSVKYNEQPTGPSGAHTFSVKALDAAGNVSAASNTVATEGCGFDTFGAPPVTGLAASNVTESSATLSWTNPPLPSWCYHAPTNFDIRVNDKPVAQAPAGATSYTIQSLEVGKRYALSVRANPPGGNGPGPSPAPVPSVEVVTIGDIPTPGPPTPVPPTPTPAPSTVEQTYILNGNASLKTLTKGSFPLNGVIDAKLNLGTGDFSGQLGLGQSTGNLTALGFLPVVAKVVLLPTEPVTGSLKDGKLTAAAKIRIKLPSVKTLGIELAGGANCQAKQVSSINLRSTQDEFLPLEGGPIAGTFAISNLTGCGFLTGLVSPLTQGSGNTIALNLIPAPIPPRTS